VSSQSNSAVPGGAVTLGRSQTGISWCERIVGARVVKDEVGEPERLVPGRELGEGCDAGEGASLGAAKPREVV
jgi:hypothetical protein